MNPYRQAPFNICLEIKSHSEISWENEYKAFLKRREDAKYFGLNFYECPPMPEKLMK